MLRLVADEDFDGQVVSAMRRQPAVDLVRVQDVGLRQASDPAVLAWAAEQGRVVLSHDRSTLPYYAYARVRDGLPMPGVIILRQSPPPGQAAAAVLSLVSGLAEGQLEGQVRFVHL